MRERIERINKEEQEREGKKRVEKERKKKLKTYRIRSKQLLTSNFDHSLNKIFKIREHDRFSPRIFYRT